jgi:hypothetical protein
MIVGDTLPGSPAGSSWQTPAPGRAWRGSLRVSLSVALSATTYLAWASLTSGTLAGCSGLPQIDCQQALSGRRSRWFSIPVSVPGLIAGRGRAAEIGYRQLYIQRPDSVSRRGFWDAGGLPGNQARVEVRRGLTRERHAAVIAARCAVARLCITDRQHQPHAGGKIVVVFAQGLAIELIDFSPS